jgi:hypothetical protein
MGSEPWWTASSLPADEFLEGYAPGRRPDAPNCGASGHRELGTVRVEGLDADFRTEASQENQLTRAG